MTDSMTKSEISLRTCLPADSVEVIKLGDKNKNSLGLLPWQAIEKYINDGNVIGAFDQKKLVGYLLFSLPRYEIRITHLCVDSKFTGQGIAKKLTEFLVLKHGERRGIILHCRRDWNVNSIWPRLNFSPIDAKKGRGLAGTELTVWWRDFGHPDLFTLATIQEDSIRICIDANVIRDLTHPKNRTDRSKFLIDPTLRSQLRWCHTKSLAVEINETISKQDERRETLSFLNAQSLLVESNDTLANSIFQKLKSTIPKKVLDRDSSILTDIQHIAESIVGECSIFVTNDEKLQTAIQPVAKELGINIFSPAETALWMASGQDESRYAPGWLLNSALTIRRPQLGEEIPSEHFLSHPTGENKSSLKAKIRSIKEKEITAGSSETKIIELNQDPLAIFSINLSSPNCINVPLLRIAKSDIENALARQVLFELQNTALNQGISTIRVTDEHSGPSKYVKHWLANDGWNRDDRHWTKNVVRKFEDHSGQISPRESAQREHLEWPLKVLKSGIETWTVSIKSSFASTLLNHDDHLPFTNPLLAISRERVYFCGTPIRAETTSALRILWYVSGKNGGFFAGTSQIYQQVSGKPVDIFERFKNYGVLSRDQVTNQANRFGRVTAVVFRDTEIFDRRIPLSTMAQWFEDDERKRPPFLRPVSVSESLFERAYRYGFNL